MGGTGHHPLTLFPVPKADGSISDVIPWQCWTRYPEHCGSSQAVFFDIDFEPLARRKRQVILETPELASQLSEVQTEEDELYPNLLLRSKGYHLVGCDLRRSAVLQQALLSILNPSECIFLFIAEVSITYMERHYADALIQWASSLGQGEPTESTSVAVILLIFVQLSSVYLNRSFLTVPATPLLAQ